MAKDRMIGLGLQEHAGGSGLVAALRPVIDRALAVLGDVIESSDENAQRRETVAEIGRCRALLAELQEPQRIEATSDALFASCDAAIQAMATERTTRQSEVTALIALVREAVSTIAGDNTAFSKNLDQTTARFEAMTQLKDLHQLKERLAAEVVTLKQIAVERKKSWESTVSGFETRVATLERQLVSTRREASLDPLTRIANRRTFDRMCQSWLESERSQFVLALLDLDDFKRINDTHGHSVGDRVLLTVAQSLKTSVRSSDLVARFGGDEFALLASGVTLYQAEGRLKAVAAELAKASVIPGEDQGITVSCGIAEFSAGDTIDSLMHRADQALYEAKRRGKNRVAVKTQAFIRDLLGK